MTFMRPPHAAIESGAAADLNVLHPHRERLDLVVEMLSNCEFRLGRVVKICMIGAGYVGLVSAACFADFGWTVTCVDKAAIEFGLGPD